MRDDPIGVIRDALARYADAGGACEHQIEGQSCGMCEGCDGRLFADALAALDDLIDQCLRDGAPPARTADLNRRAGPPRPHYCACGGAYWTRANPEKMREFYRRYNRRRRAAQRGDA